MAQALAKEEWNTSADSVWQFGLLAAPNLGEYGGGDGLKLSCPILVMKLPPSRIPPHILHKLPDQINACITKNNKIPKDKRVARLPEKHIDADEFLHKWNKSCHFELQSHVPLATSNRYNLMFQGWLFKEIPNDPQRLGCSLFPLIGIYDSYGCVEFNQNIQLDKNDEALHYAGYNDLQWSDHHCHLDFGAWHFGSDMSKIIVNKNRDIVKLWSVCVDVDNKQIDVSLIYIIGHMYVSQMEGMIRNCNPQESRQKCQEFYSLFTICFEQEFEKMKGEKSVLYDLLFGKQINEQQAVEKSDDASAEQKENISVESMNNAQIAPTGD